MIYGTLILAALVVSAKGQLCYPPFENVGGVCILVSTDKPATWQESRDFCKSLGGDGYTSDLAIFPTCDAFSAFAGYLGFTATQAYSTFWVGAHTEFTPNNWRWINGEPLPTGVPYWAYVEGHDDGQECAAMDASANFQLADFDCNEPRFFVCSMPTIRQDLNRVHVRYHDRECPSNSVEIGDYCYWFSWYRKSWEDAEDYCRSEFSSNYGELFAPSSCDEFAQMAHHLEVAEGERRYWVGASDVTGNQEWFWVNGDPVPGGPPFWANDAPSDHSSNYDSYCALMTNSKRFYLEDERCSDENRFICKVRANQL